MNSTKQLSRTPANIPLLLCLTHMANMVENAFRSRKFSIKGSKNAQASEYGLGQGHVALSWA